MEGCENAWFKQRAVIKFLTAEGIPPIDVCHHTQAVYGGKCADVSTIRWGTTVQAR